MLSLVKLPALVASVFIIGVCSSQDGRSIFAGLSSSALTALTWKYFNDSYITDTSVGSICLMAAAVTGTIAVLEK